MSTIIDGKQTAATILAELKEQVSKLGDARPGLAVIIVGNDPASETYVRSKIKRCGEVGFYSIHRELPENTTQKELKAEIEALNNDDNVHGILVQLPLPGHINETETLDYIKPSKDVDGFLPHNLGLLLQGRNGVLPCTPKGIIELLKRYKIETPGKHAVVLGRSNIVGKPISVLLAQKGVDCTVTQCHSRTQNLEQVLQSADIIVAAIGRPKFVTANMVKPGAVIIDVGINRTESGLVGDVDFAAVNEKASAITPVPGGVGPMTIAMLLQNCLQNYSAIRQTVSA